VTRNAVASVRTHDSFTNSDRQEELGKMKVLCLQVFQNETRCRLSSCPVPQLAAQLYRTSFFCCTQMSHNSITHTRH